LSTFVVSAAFSKEHQYATIAFVKTPQMTAGFTQRACIVVLVCSLEEFTVTNIHAGSFVASKEVGF
jgi:hypothetical protein